MVGVGLPLSQMAAFARIFRHNFYGHESFSSSAFFPHSPFPILLSRFRFCFTFANCQCKAASDMKLFRFASVFPFFFIFLAKVEINFTVNAHNQVCVALVPPWTWQHDKAASRMRRRRRIPGKDPQHSINGKCKKVLHSHSERTKR